MDDSKEFKVNSIKSALVVSSFALLSACGGGGGSSNPDQGIDNSSNQNASAYNIESYVKSGVDASDLSGIWMAVESFTYKEKDGSGGEYSGNGNSRRLFFLKEEASGMIAASSCELNESVSAAGNALNFTDDDSDISYSLNIESNTKLSGTTSHEIIVGSSVEKNYSGTVKFVKIASLSQMPTVSGTISITSSAGTQTGTFQSLNCFEENSGTETHKSSASTRTYTGRYMQAGSAANENNELYFEVLENSEGFKYSEVHIDEEGFTFAATDNEEAKNFSLSIESNTKTVSVSSQFVYDQGGSEKSGNLNNFKLTLP